MKNPGKNSDHTASTGEALIFVWSFFKIRPHIYLSFGFLLLVMVLAEISIPVTQGRLIDAVATNFAGDNEEVAQIWFYFWVLAGLFAMYWIPNYTQLFWWSFLQSRFMREIVAEAFGKVQGFSTDWHNNTFAGKTVREITRGVRAFETLTDVLLFNLIPSALVMLGIIVSVLMFLPLIGIWVFFISLITAGLSIFLSLRFVSPLNQDANLEDSRLGGALADAITCNAVVRSFGAELKEMQRLQMVLHNWRNKYLKTWIVGNLTALLTILAIMLNRFGMLAGAIIMWLHEMATPGDIVFMISAAGVIQGYLRDVSQRIRDVQMALNEMEAIVAFRRMKPAVEDKPDAVPLKSGKGEIVFENVTFRYGPELSPIYRDFNLCIAPGEKVALVGRSGSGKSTFVKLLERLYDIDEGAIRVDGRDIRDVTQESLRQAISIVPQDPALFHRSLEENIAYAKPDATREEVIEAAKKAHAHEFIINLPDGYESLVGERGIKLSGGERQRVAIARAILADTPVLVLDEATSSLDSVSEQMIQDALKTLMAGRTVIIIAHRLSTIRDADRILVFHDGSIVEEGPHTTLLARKNGTYRELYTAQSEGFIT